MEGIHSYLVAREKSLLQNWRPYQVDPTGSLGFVYYTLLIWVDLYLYLIFVIVSATVPVIVGCSVSCKSLNCAKTTEPNFWKFTCVRAHFLPKQLIDLQICSWIRVKGPIYEVGFQPFEVIPHGLITIHFSKTSPLQVRDPFLGFTVFFYWDCQCSSAASVHQSMFIS